MTAATRKARTTGAFRPRSPKSRRSLSAIRAGVASGPVKKTDATLLVESKDFGDAMVAPLSADGTVAATKQTRRAKARSRRVIIKTVLAPTGDASTRPREHVAPRRSAGRLG